MGKLDPEIKRDLSECLFVPLQTCPNFTHAAICQMFTKYRTKSKKKELQVRIHLQNLRILEFFKQKLSNFKADFGIVPMGILRNATFGFQDFLGISWDFFEDVCRSVRGFLEQYTCRS